MKHIEVSRKIKLSKEISVDEIRAILLDRLEKAIEIEDVEGEAGDFSIRGTTGTPTGLTRHARLDLDVNIIIDDGIARIMVSGFVRAAKSLNLSYALFFFLLMVVGLLPGSIETSAESSGAVDALVFLVFGIYIILDINKKLSEPREYLETVFQSLDTTFG